MTRGAVAIAVWLAAQASAAVVAGAPASPQGSPPRQGRGATRATPARQSPAPGDRAAFDAIYALVSQGRFPEARDEWNRLAARLQERQRAAPPDPSTPPPPWVAEALFTQGLLTARGGDRAEALQFLQKADGLGFPPLDSPLMRLVADCLLELREFERAIAAYREIVKHAPANAEARLALANALYSGGKMGPARTEAEEAVRLGPKLPRARYTLGAVLFEQHDYDQARAQLERELALDPRCTPCLSRLAHIAYLQGDEKGCESWLAKALAQDPQDVESRFVSGLLAFRAGRYDAAIEHLSFVAERSPDFPAPHYQLSLAYRRAGNAEKAREQLEIYQRLLKEQKAREIGVRGAR